MRAGWCPQMQSGRLDGPVRQAPFPLNHSDHQHRSQRAFSTLLTSGWDLPMDANLMLSLHGASCIDAGIHR